MGKASVKIQISTHTKELTLERSPLRVMNVEKNLVRTPILLNIGELTQVSSLILVTYAEETSAGGQAFLGIRNSTSEGGSLSSVISLNRLTKWSLMLKFVEKYKIMKHEFFISGIFGAISIMLHRKESNLTLQGMH